MAVTNLLLLAHPVGSEDWLRGPQSDDAFYYYSVARNAAHGNGLTYAGTPTNGFQPLYLGVAFLLGKAADWEPVSLPAAVHVANWAIYTLLGSFISYKIGNLLRPANRSPRSLFPVLLWLCFIPLVRLATNGMETALTLTASMGVLFLTMRWLEYPESLGRAAVVALSLGVAFWSRNDLALLAVAVCLVVLFSVVRNPPQPTKQLRSLVLASALAAAVMAPWLAWNFIQHGSPVPQSGRAEAVGGLYDLGRATQIAQVLIAFARNLCPLPLPFEWLPLWLRTLASALVVVSFAAIAALGARRVCDKHKPIFAIAGGASIGLAVVYATAFGAPHMCARWLAPVALLGFLAIVGFAQHLSSRSLLVLSSVLIIGWVARSVVDGRRGAQTNTWPIAQFAVAHRDSGVVGTFQSGLPNWLVPTVQNLDGKVNGEVLDAIREGRLADWLVDSELDWVVDFDLFRLDQHRLVREHFELIAPASGLKALRRKVPRSP